MPAVVGRESELAEGEGFLDAITARPAALVLTGEAGTGKTTLWAELVRRGRKRSCRTLSCSPSEPEARLSLGSISDLLSGVEDEAYSSLPGAQRRAVDVALLRAEAGECPPDPRAVATGFLSLVSALAKEEPLLIGIDDAQWLDRSSARVLEFAVRRFGDRRVGVLVSVRGSEEVASPLALDRALPGENLWRLPVGPLTPAAIHELISMRLGGRFHRSTLARIHATAGGNPFFALEIARLLLRRGTPALGAALQLPENLRALVAGRIRPLPSQTREALLVAAAASEPTTALVAAALGSDEALAAAEQEGVVEIDGAHVRFTHPLLSSGIYAAAPFDARRRAHRRLGAVAEDLEERARQLALASDERDEGVAEALDNAAANARGRGAPDSAAELLELAIRRGRDNDRRTILAAEHHFHAGGAQRARELLEGLIARLPSGTTRASALLLLAEVRYSDDSFPEAALLLERALAEAGTDPQLLASIEVALAFSLVSSGDMNGVAPHARAAVCHAEDSGDRSVLAQTLAVATISDFQLGRGLDYQRLEHALALEDPDKRCVIEMRPTLIAALLWMWTGDFESARRAHATLRDGILNRGEERDVVLQAFYFVLLECWRGDFRAAAGYADEAMEASGMLDSAFARALANSAKAAVDAYMGQADAARAAAATALALFDEAGYNVGPVWALSSLGLLELSLGDAAAADGALGELADFIRATGLREPMAATFLGDEIEALVALGRLDAAESLLESLEQTGRRLDRAWALAVGGRCRGLLLAARGNLPGAMSAIEQALVEHARLAMPLEHARTLLILGRVQRRTKRRRAARASLEQAIAVFAELGAPLWADLAREELERLGAQRCSPDRLTPSEERVAELAASGLTNREVAGALFMSPKTVEANLSRVYRKLSIHSRAELGALMGQTTTVGPEAT